MDKITAILTRGVANIIPGREELEKAIKSGKKLNVYIGVDPTATKIHLGHAVPLRKLQALAEEGHHVTFLIGDFTALIGDTSDKDTERPVLTKEQIQENFQTYKKQAEKILDFTKVKVRKNSEWLSKLTFEDIVKLCQHFSVGDFISRELIRRRLDAGTRVALHEVLYPVMQGYDSYFMDTDLQLGGTDQTFNMQAGRTLQKDLRGKESFVMSNMFLTGTDGRKMSKSWGNAIWLDDPPYDMYAKVMAINDDLILEYFMLGTNAPMEYIFEIENRLKNDENPMIVKKELAEVILTELYDKEVAEDAADNFQRVVQEKELPSKIQEITVGSNENTLENYLVETTLASSKSEAKRLIEQGGVRFNNEVIKDPDKQVVIDPETLIQVGKRKIVRLKTS